MRTTPSQHPFTARKLSLVFTLNGTHSHLESTRVTSSEHSLLHIYVNDVVTRNKNKPKDPITTVPKRDVCIVLPFLGLQNKIITKQLKSCIYKFYGCVNLKIIFRNTLRIKSLFSPTRTGLTALSSLRLYTRLAAGTVATFIKVLP